MVMMCPNVKWKDSYALMGRFDVLDIVEAENAAIDIGNSSRWAKTDPPFSVLDDVRAYVLD